MQNGSIRRDAARLRLGLLVVMAGATLLYLVARLDLELGSADVEYRSRSGGMAVPSWVADGSLLLLLIASFQLTRLLALIAGGESFSAAVVGRFRSFAFWLLVMALFGFAAPLVTELLRGRPDGAHRFALVIDLGDLLLLGITLLLFLLARLLEKAREIEAEMREFV